MNYEFILERSCDGIHFSKVYEHSTEESISSSRHIESDIAEGPFYYRIGYKTKAHKHWSYSDIIVSYSKANAGVRVQYNKSVKLMKITSRQPLSLIEIFDLKGRVIRSVTTNVFSTAGIPRGLYIIKMRTKITSIDLRMAL